MFGFFESKSFNAETHIPDLSGKTILVTGGNIGLGKATCLALAKHHPGHIYLSARSPEKAAKAIEDIQQVEPNASISFLECDLASLASVEKAAEEFKAKSSKLDLLFCNAGIMAVPPAVTTDGYEIQFGTNHVGHALLIKLLLPTLLKTAEQPGSDVRVVILSSTGHKWTPPGGIQFERLRSSQESVGKWPRYGQSKLANILYAKALARRYPNVKFVAVHPGLVGTNLAASLIDGSHLYNAAMMVANLIPSMIKTPEEGAKNQLWAATGSKAEVLTGQYYEPVAIAGCGSALSNDEKLSEDLWSWTEKELGTYRS